MTRFLENVGPTIGFGDSILVMAGNAGAAAHGWMRLGKIFSFGKMIKLNATFGKTIKFDTTLSRQCNNKVRHETRASAKYPARVLGQG